MYALMVAALAVVAVLSAAIAVAIERARARVLEVAVAELARLLVDSRETLGKTSAQLDAAEAQASMVRRANHELALSWLLQHAQTMRRTGSLS